MQDSVLGGTPNSDPSPAGEPMNFHELYLHAQGLRQTALNAVNAGQGGNHPQSIVRDAAERLVAAAIVLSGEAPALGNARIHPQMTWSEVLAFAESVSAWATLRQEQQAQASSASPARPPAF